jgi:outer membrane protein assembly factor BamB
MSTEEPSHGRERPNLRPAARKIVIALAVVLILAAMVAVREYVISLDCRQPPLTVIDDPAQLDNLHLELLEHQPESWVRRYDPNESSPGYNLVFYRRRVPLIIDMNGRIVHSWPLVRATGRVRLNRDGSLAVIGSDNLIKEYTWDGELVWHFQLKDAHNLPHHDLIRLRNGNYLILAHDGHSHTDYLLEVDRAGKVIWDWYFEKHTADFSNWDPESTDPSHSNSIRELPPNRWYDNGDERFRPGNILVSARSLDTIFIIDKTSGDVVWNYSKGLDGQHEAAMIQRGARGEGLIIVFNNGLENLSDYRRSKVQIIHPLSGEVVWEYSSELFFSSVGGTAQPLPGNNVLITSSHGGRVFEIRPGGQIVWEWVPPFLPMRVERVAYDHCPQLANLGTPAETEVVLHKPRPHVDADLYRFAFKWETEERIIDDHRKWVIQPLNDCRDLRIPRGATLHTEFGFDRTRYVGRSVAARFRVTVDDHDRPPKTVVDVTLDESSKPLWHRQKVALGRYSMRKVTMCIETEVEGEFERPEEFVLWANPQILSRKDRERRAVRSERITEQERRLREQQLKALGYVD